ncbi:ATP-binding cassette domain-containing protein [Mahella sp.]|uniref:ABC transporter ATP-binding protein n=1 Tax=Mahella sp. TaxID=2798721 RepID=UPI0025C46EFF|nr:ATP-binding cassette domain-containing protein [Mahella sp.]MBZ4666326.1 transporter related [Mahella sp.]
MLELKNVSKAFNKGTVNENVVFSDLNFTLNEGDFVSVIGSNGAGKSTLLNLIAGVFSVDGGQLLLDGNDITKLPEHKRARFIGRVFQDPMMGTAPSMTIEENMAVAYARSDHYSLRWGINPQTRDMFRERLSYLGLALEDRLSTKVELLSGGQRQAMTLLIATMSNPRLLLLDEHTAALDPATVRLINDLTERIINEQHITTLMVTHNLEHAIKMGNRLIMMDRGSIVLDIKDDEKRSLTIEQLLDMFEQAAHEKFSDDRVILQ